MIRLSFQILAFVCLAAPGLAQETRLRAVLVGVGDYLTLDADLSGPPNDVALVADMLLRRGVMAADITILTDPGAALPAGVHRTEPDKSAILAAFARAISDSAAGDTVLFYFSGHGTQAPDTDGDEGGGADELFLPRDAGAWSGAAGEVENAIRDDELGALVARATGRGVRVVGIVDACHSATGFRAVDDTPGRARYVAPETLGIPETDATPVPATAAPDGAYVFLYAAQSDQRAFEYPVGEGGPWHGDFTRNLVSVLNDVPRLSYDQLVQATAQRLRTRSGQAAQTPDIEGPMAQDAVFGGDAPALRRIAVEGTTLKAGLLQNLTVGSDIALYADLTAAEPVGHARITGLRATEADLTFLDPYPTTRVTHAEVTRRAIDVSFAISIAPTARAALDDLVPEGAALLQAALDLPVSDTAHRRLVWTGTAFALVGRDGVLDALGPGTSPRLMTPGSSDDPITDLALALTAQARRARLEQALDQMAGTGTSAFALFPSGPDVKIRQLAGQSAAGRCRLTGDARPVDTVAQTGHCDGLEIQVINSTTDMQDVTVLYLAADGGIVQLWPQRNLSNRIPSGETRKIRVGLRNDGPHAVRETLLVLSLPGAPGSARTVLGGLADGQTRGAADPMAAYLATLADPATSQRSLSLTPPGGDLNMTRLDLTVSPLN